MRSSVIPRRQLLVGAAALTAHKALANTPPNLFAYSAGGTAWTPLSLSNLVGFWRADVGVTQSSGAVSAWADQSSNAYTMVTGGQPSPTWSSTAFNAAKPGVSFAAGNDGLNNTGVALATATCSMFILFEKLAGSAQYDRFAWLEANGVGVDYNTPSVTWDEETAGNFQCVSSSALSGAVSLTASTSYLLGTVFDGANATTYNAATSQGAAAFSSTIGSNPNTFGVGNAPNGGSEVYTIAFVVLTAAAMSSTDIANMKTWTNTNWGTSF